MPILNYTTQIDSAKTIAEIQKCLVEHGAHKIITDYAGDMPVALTFQLNVDGNPVAFHLPCNYAGVLKALDKNKRVPRRMVCQEQALRVCWRILKDWVEAQMAIVEA